MGKEQERVIRQYAIRFGASEILLPKGAEVLTVSQLHDRPILFAVVDVLLTHQEQRVFHLLETGIAFQRTANLRHIGSLFALQKWFHAFEEMPEAKQ
jgi:hypothetical protein